MTKKQKQLIEKLRNLYDNNVLSEEDEVAILDTLLYLSKKESILLW